MNPDELRSLILVALGEASMCWSELPSGVFDSERAIAIADRLVNAIPLQQPPAVPSPLLRSIVADLAAAFGIAELRSTPTVTAQDSTK